MFSTLVSNSKKVIKEIVDFPNVVMVKFIAFINFFKSIKLKIKNLEHTNLELGIFHLKKGNIFDAIIRFYITAKIFPSIRLECYYWLGWCYLIYDKYNKSVNYFNLTNSSKELVQYLNNYRVYQFIPKEIRQQYTSLIASYYINNFFRSKISLPYQFIKLILEEIKEIPIDNNYRILDLGCKEGFLGEELQNHIFKRYFLCGIEENSEIINYLHTLKNTNLYDNILNVSIEEYLEQDNECYNLIISFNTLYYKKNLLDSFAKIFSLLYSDGIFAVVLPIHENLDISNNKMYFFYKATEIKQQLKSCGFSLAKYTCIEIKGIMYGIFINKK